MLKTTIKITYLCTHDYCVDIGKANHVFYNLESMIQKWKLGPKFSVGDHIFRKNWSAGTIVGSNFSEGDHIFRKNWSAGTIFTGTNIPVTGPSAALLTIAAQMRPQYTRPRNRRLRLGLGLGLDRQQDADPTLASSDCVGG